MMPFAGPALLHNRGHSNRHVQIALNSLFTMLGIENWKPVLTALLLPPVPWLLLMLIGARLLLPRRGLGWLVVLLSVVLMWLSFCTGTARLLNQFVVRPPPALSLDGIKALKGQKATAIIVLGGGMQPFAPEYGVSNLSEVSLERLRYGVWLSRQTGLPLGFSGGVGWGQPDAKPEAQIAAQIAAVEFGLPLRWVEDNSRDTHENALRTVALLRPAGIQHIVLVTSGPHMPRALRDFEAAAAGAIQIVPAPMGMARGNETSALTWMPTSNGIDGVRESLREVFGRLAGA